MKSELRRQYTAVCFYGVLFLVCVGVVLLAAPLTDAQSTAGRVRGTVTDSSGAAVAGALQVAAGMRKGIIVTLLPDRGDRYLSTTLFRSVCACCPP